MEKETSVIANRWQKFFTPEQWTELQSIITEENLHTWKLLSALLSDLVIDRFEGGDCSMSTTSSMLVELKTLLKTEKNLALGSGNTYNNIHTTISSKTIVVRGIEDHRTIGYGAGAVFSGASIGKMIWASLKKLGDHAKLLSVKVTNESRRIETKQINQKRWDEKPIEHWKMDDFYDYFIQLYEKKYRSFWVRKPGVHQPQLKRHHEVFVKDGRTNPNEDFRKYIEWAFQRYGTKDYIIGINTLGLGLNEWRVAHPAAKLLKVEPEVKVSEDRIALGKLEEKEWLEYYGLGMRDGQLTRTEYYIALSYRNTLPEVERKDLRRKQREKFKDHPEVLEKLKRWEEEWQTEEWNCRRSLYIVVCRKNKETLKSLLRRWGRENEFQLFSPEELNKILG